MNFSVLKRASIGVVCCIALYAAPTSFAQPQDPAENWKEPGVRFLDEASPWKQWLAAALFAGGVLAMAAKNPHRGHLD